MSAKTLTVFEPGTLVWIVGHDGDAIPATVTGVCIFANNQIKYHVSWWDGRTRKEEWMEEQEVIENTDEGGSRYMPIGFMNGSCKEK